MSLDLREAITDFNKLIANGVNDKDDILKAMHKWYHPEAVVYINQWPPRTGKEACIKEEETALEAMDWHEMKVLNVAVGENLTMVEWYMNFDTDGVNFTGHLVAIHEWKDEQIIKESFYFNEPTG